ncbi:glycosyltransferase family 4 protein [Glutamicibacter nicotianae]|uniref:glycosyltransferase family 4 protein n=1 Tax=Glutamicibacter nicotianae TaxID=37929 RepID=UPI000EF8BE42|nr:glycosyltransferase family 4 protein [Glutamicibacter nicotianae]
MRIQLLTHSFGSEISPPQRRWSTFIETFLENGVDVDVVAPNRKNGIAWTPYSEALLAEVSGRFALHSFAFRFKGLRWYTKLLAQFSMIIFMIPCALRAPKPDLLLVTVPALPTLVAGYVIAKLRKLPMVVELRDAWPELLEESGIIRWKAVERVAVRSIWFMLNSASKIIAVTPGHAEKLIARGCKNVDVVTNGYRFNKFKKIKSRSCSSNDRLHVLYLGNLGESQGIQKVLDIAAVSKSWMDLRIVGRGSALYALQNRARELGLDDIFIPPVKGEEVLAWYDWADTCLVSLREDWESFEYTVPSKLFELAGYGCHITGLVTGEARGLIEKYNLGFSYSGDVLSIAHSWSADAPRISRWEPNPSALAEFKDRFDFERLGREYFNLLKSHQQHIKGTES